MSYVIRKGHWVAKMAKVEFRAYPKIKMETFGHIRGDTQENKPRTILGFETPGVLCRTIQRPAKHPVDRLSLY